MAIELGSKVSTKTTEVTIVGDYNDSDELFLTTSFNPDNLENMLRDIAVLVDFYSYDNEYSENGWDVREEAQTCFEYYVSEIYGLNDVDDVKLDEYYDELLDIAPYDSESCSGVYSITAVDFIVKGEEYSGISFTKTDVKEALESVLK